MANDRTPATTAQIKALGSPIRLRILRLCLHDELTNKQLATRLDLDPSTLLYHVRKLVETGFLERSPERRGAGGAVEKPYKSTGLSWTLDLGTHDVDATQAMLDAFSAELAEAGVDSVEASSRFVLHLDDQHRREMLDRIQAILDEYEASDDERAQNNHPRLGGLFLIHNVKHSNETQTPTD